MIYYVVITPSSKSEAVFPSNYVSYFYFWLDFDLTLDLRLKI